GPAPPACTDPMAAWSTGRRVRSVAMWRRPKRRRPSSSRRGRPRTALGSSSGKPWRYTSYKGTQHRAVVPGPERFGKSSMERRLTLRVAEGGQNLAQTDLQRDFIRLTGNGYELRAMNRFWYFKRQDVDLGEGSLL